MSLPTVSVTAGQTAVAVAGATVIAIAGDLLTVNGVSAPIQAATATTITLAYGWPGATAAASPNWSVANIAPAWSTGKQTYVAVNDLLDRISAALPYTPGANGTLAGRDGYANQPRNFVYLATSPGPWTVYVKQSDAVGDWSPGQAVHTAASTTTESEAARDQAQAAATTATDKAAVATDAAGSAYSQAGIAHDAASTATTQAGLAQGSASTAATQAATATTQASSATTSAATATTQAGSATTSAATATTQATLAQGSASTATTQASAAAGSAAAAAGSATTAATQATNAAASASLAQSTVAAGRVGVDTLAQLSANLTPSDGAQGEVINDGANNGLYRKNGASGAGSWVKISSATIPALDALTAFARRVLQSNDATAFDLVDEQGLSGLRFDGMNGLVTLLANIATLAVGQLSVGQIKLDATTTLASTPTKGFEIADDQGSVVFRVDESGLQLLNLALAGGLTTGSIDLGAYQFSTYADPNVALIVTDSAGFAIAALSKTGGLQVGSIQTAITSGDDYSSDEIAERSARAVALSSGYRGLLDTTSAAAVWAYSHFFEYGQSLSQGAEGWPARTGSVADILMVGQSVRPRHLAASDTYPYGDSTLRAAYATVQSANDSTIIDAAGQAALSPGDPAAGETASLVALQFARRLYLQRMGASSAPDRKWVLSSCGVGGKSVAELSKGASPELFNRLRIMANAGKAAATAAGGTYGVPTVFYYQGERDYQIATAKAPYKTTLKQLYDDIYSDICVGIAGQTEKPAIITYQTGGSYTNDATDLSIGQAQWEMSQENPGWYLAAPNYPVTDKGGHLDPNGYRWLGCQMGKVFFETVILRRRWKPLSPIQSTVRGQTVLVDFHLPSGTPLQFQPVYLQSVATTYSDRGFTVIDDSGTIALVAVDIVGDATVRLRLSRKPVGTVRVYYARLGTFTGGGNLCDSDPTVAPFTYTYAAGSGDYAAANIASLIGQPYPLWNWCIAFAITATAN